MNHVSSAPGEGFFKQGDLDGLALRVAEAREAGHRFVPLTATLPRDMRRQDEFGQKMANHLRLVVIAVSWHGEWRVSLSEY